MVSLTQADLRKIFPNAAESKLKASLPYLNAAMTEFGITTKLRVAAFLSQIAVESAELKYFSEIASGAAYEGRKDLGNTQKGDGKRFKGRGVIQLTGRSNYREAGKDLGLPLEDSPEIVATPAVAFRTAGWFWKKKGLNALADKGDIREVTRRVNGAIVATTHYPERVEYYKRALKVLPDNVLAEDTHKDAPDVQPEKTVEKVGETPTAPEVKKEEGTEVVATPAPNPPPEKIAAIPPLPVQLPPFIKKFLGWGAGLSIPGLGGIFAWFQGNPSAVLLILGLLKWFVIVVAAIALIIIIYMGISKLYYAKLANDLNKARLQNFANPNTKNVDFSGWKTPASVDLQRGVAEKPAEVVEAKPEEKIQNA